MRLGRLAFAPLVLVAALAPELPACSSSSPAPSNDAGPTAAPEDLLSPDQSCAFDCDSTCEPAGYQCAAMGDWSAIPHAAACGSWDGKTFPAVVAGKCTASAPSGDAAKPTGTDPADPSTFILPTGARATPAGKASIFTDFKGQFPTNVVPVPGTDLFVVVDGGIGEQSVRLVDSPLIGSATDPVVGSQKFVDPTQTNYGAALVPGANANEQRLYISGGAGALLYAFTVDTAAKTLTRETGADIKISRPSSDPAGGGLGSQYYLSGVTATPDGKRLFVGTAAQPSMSAPLFVVDVDPTSTTFQQVIKSIPLHADEIFAIAIAPGDAAGRYAYATIWDAGQVAVVDTQTGAVSTINVGAYPEAIAPVGGQFLAVVNAAGDSISLIDTLPPGGSTVLTVPIEGALHGWVPNGLAYDDAAQRLYVSLGGMNAVAAFGVDVSNPAAPTLTPDGMLPSDWWPTAVALRQDGSLVVVTGKGHGTGPDPTPFGPGEGDITDKMRGSIQLIPTPDAAALTAGQAKVTANTDVASLAGASKVDCGGAPYDFPIPADNQSGPSAKIKHVIFVVKENKTFDAIFGDQQGVAGDASLVMIPKQMDTVFGNQRKVAKTFTNFDNYYTSAEQSIQGHVWTVFGRTNDYTERTWLVTWGRATRGTIAQSTTRTVEGGLFHWLQRERVLFDDMGEAVGTVADDGHAPKNCCEDPQFPGGFVISQDIPDSPKNCYIVARARATCDLKPVTYVLNPNDHTSGLAAGRPTPETYIAIGDEGLGILVDGLSRSPIWQDTLVIVTEDDPQDGGDHIDLHRTPLYMAGPWVKRGYVSKGHYDVSSIHKLIAHIFGIAYPNDAVAHAAIPFDAFTSTPDYSPYAMLPRTTPLACNPSGTSGAATAAMAGWDFSEPDNQPGLSRQLWMHFHGGAEPSFRPADDD